MSDLPGSLIGLLEKPECSGGIADIAWLLEMYLAGEFDNRSIEERAAIETFYNEVATAWLKYLSCGWRARPNAKCQI